MKETIPNRLIFSSSNPKRRKRAFLLIGFLFLFQLCLIWPIYPVFGGAEPFILGFPLSFAWVIFILVLSFLALLLFFKSENNTEDN